MCSSINDFEQELLDIFIRQINIKSAHPIVIIATTNSIENLSPVFLRIFLKCQQIGNLNKINREELFKWILKRDSITLDSTTIKNVVEHTSGFNYMDFMTLLLLSTK